MSLSDTSVEILDEYFTKKIGVKSVWVSSEDRSCYSLTGFDNGRMQFRRGDGRVLSLTLAEAQKAMTPT